MGVARIGFRRHLGAAGALVAALVFAPAAQALSAPEVFLQEDGPEQPACRQLDPAVRARACVRSTAGRSACASRTPVSRETLSGSTFVVNSVPSGSPIQPDVYSNICPEVTGAAGQIVPASQNGPEDIRYQGDGTYSISVTATPAASGDIGTNCRSGPTTTGTFYRVGSDHDPIRRAHGHRGSEPARPVRRDRGVPGVRRRRH